MTNPKRDDHRILTHQDAPSAEANFPVYHGFPLLEATRSEDGWCFGAITKFEAAEGVETGDAFVEAPDGTRAGIVWGVGDGKISQVLPPEPARWGVYALPELRSSHKWARGY